MGVLDDTSESVRKVTVKYLASFGADAIPSLIGALHDEDPLTREGAAISLGRMAARRPDAISLLKQEVAPVLLEAIEDPDQRVRVQAAIALWRINRLPEQVLPTLVRAWREGDCTVRYYAGQGLQQMGPDAKDAVPALVVSLRATWHAVPAIAPWHIKRGMALLSEKARPSP